MRNREIIELAVMCLAADEAPDDKDLGAQALWALK